MNSSGVVGVGSDGLLREGTKVEARYRGRGRYYPGVIARTRADGTYDIDYDDGEKETGVRGELVRVVEAPDAKGVGGMNSSGGEGVVWGRRVRVGVDLGGRRRSRDRYYPGVIARTRADGTYNIEIDDGEKGRGGMRARCGGWAGARGGGSRREGRGWHEQLGRRGCWQRRVAARGHEGGSSVSRARPVLPWCDCTHPRRRHVRHRLRRRREGDGRAWRAGARGGGSRREGRGWHEQLGRRGCWQRRVAARGQDRKSVV